MHIISWRLSLDLAGGTYVSCTGDRTWRLLTFYSQLLRNTELHVCGVQGGYLLSCSVNKSTLENCMLL